MAELKFISGNNNKVSSCCDRDDGRLVALPTGSRQEAPMRDMPAWSVGTHDSGAGPVLKISTVLSPADHWEHIKCRISAFRNNYAVTPGLYAAGEPDAGADVFVSANYKLSFDHLRRSLNGINAWVLVLDTKGINVWCAAGKGTFGTHELVMRITGVQLARVVTHRRIIVPQLGAPGIAAHVVLQETGFRVSYGPVRAKDIPAYIASGYTSSEKMRTITFPLIDRLVLTPMEIDPILKKYYPWFALLILTVFGLRPSGIFFRDAWSGGLPFLVLGLVSVFTGAFLTPVLLPFIPFRSFALKGWIAGILSVLVVSGIPGVRMPDAYTLRAAAYLFFPLASSYIALQFTGSATFTGMSGVKKELKLSIPLYIAGSASSMVLLIVHKLLERRVV